MPLTLEARGNMQVRTYFSYVFQELTAYTHVQWRCSLFGTFGFVKELFLLQ